jgi:hypothetical protein
MLSYRLLKQEVHNLPLSFKGLSNFGDLFIADSHVTEQKTVLPM